MNHKRENYVLPASKTYSRFEYEVLSFAGEKGRINMTILDIKMSNRVFSILKNQIPLNKESVFLKGVES